MPDDPRQLRRRVAVTHDAGRRRRAALRRARAAAQLLHRPRAAGVAEVVGRLLAVQAQDLRAARLALRARTTGLAAADVDAALTDERSVVVAWLMRGTLHLVGRDDYPWLLGLTAPTRLADEPPAAGPGGRGARRRRARGEDRRAARWPRTARSPAPQLAERIAASGIRTEGQATPHLLDARRAARDRGPRPAARRRQPRLRARPRLARRRAVARARGRRARRRAGRAGAPLPRRPRSRDARRPRRLERPAAARRARRAAGDRLRAGRARRRPRRPRRARARARRDPGAPAAPPSTPTCWAGRTAPSPSPPATPSAFIPAAGCCAPRRPSTGAPSAPGAPRAARSSSSLFGRVAAGGEGGAATPTPTTSRASFKGPDARPIPWRWTDRESCAVEDAGAARAHRGRAARAGRPPGDRSRRRATTGSSSPRATAARPRAAAIGHALRSARAPGGLRDAGARAAAPTARAGPLAGRRSTGPPLRFRRERSRPAGGQDLRPHATATAPSGRSCCPCARRSAREPEQASGWVRVTAAFSASGTASGTRCDSRPRAVRRRRYQCTPFMRLAIATCSIEAFSFGSFSPLAAAESGKTL